MLFPSKQEKEIVNEENLLFSFVFMRQTDVWVMMLLQGGEKREEIAPIFNALGHQKREENSSCCCRICCSEHTHPFCGRDHWSVSRISPFESNGCFPCQKKMIFQSKIGKCEHLLNFRENTYVVSACCMGCRQSNGSAFAHCATVYRVSVTQCW